MYHFLAAFAVLISIHAPRAGSDQMSIITSKWCWRFQSTLPVRGATSSYLGKSCLDLEFQSTLPVRGATVQRQGDGAVGEYFNPRSPCGERRRTRRCQRSTARISIHAPRAGSDHRQARPASRQWIFQSTLPVRGATLPRLYGGRRDFYFNPRSPCGERPSQLSGVTSLVMISIHAPRAGSDGWSCTVDAEIYISIHAPRAGSDRGRSPDECLNMNFNPRSPCGERHVTGIQLPKGLGISIHAPRAGSDDNGGAIQPAADIFQSTLPVRGATVGWVCGFTSDGISIHAPRAGSDLLSYIHVGDIWDFNPRSPCGERRRRPAMWRAVPREFQSTLPVRGATFCACSGAIRCRNISIHAPRAGSDHDVTSICFVI